jgi:AraC-like DNA-binding protein
MLLFDSASVRPRDRTDAMDAALNSALMPQSFTFSSDRLIRYRMEAWELGPGVQLMRSTGAGLVIARTARHVRQSAPEVIVLGLPAHTPSLFTGPDESQVVYVPGVIGMHDTTRPYSFRQSEVSHHTSLLIEPSRLDLPVDLIRAAVPLLRSSPVHDLLRSHMVRLCELPPTWTPGSETMTALGRATTELVWALITTAAGDRRAAEALNATLDTRITAYIETYLHQPDLGARRIATAHGISVRQLYREWAVAGHELTLSAWILRRRLERARGRLGSTPDSVTAIAHGCGFTGLAHFSTRFREAFGLSPREWRRLSHDHEHRS